MKLSLGESDYTDFTTNVLADLDLESENKNNEEIDVDLTLDALLDEDNAIGTSVGSILAVSATGSYAYEPEVNPELLLLLQPSGTGFN